VKIAALAPLWGVTMGNRSSLAQRLAVPSMARWACFAYGGCAEEDEEAGYRICARLFGRGE